MEKYDPETIKKLIDESHYSLKDEWGQDSMSALAAANTAIAMIQFNNEVDKEDTMYKFLNKLSGGNPL